MSVCDEFGGDAAIQRTPNGPRWLHADPGIHVADELIDEPMILERYEIVEPCGDRYAATHHARLKP